MNPKSRVKNYSNTSFSREIVTDNEKYAECENVKVPTLRTQ